MPTPLDLLNSTLPDLQGPLEHQFTHTIPLMKLLWEKEQVKYNGGLYTEKTFTTNPAGGGVAIRTGSEGLYRGRSQNTLKMRVEQARVVMTSHIPNIDQIKNQGKAAVMDVASDYLTMLLEGAMQDFNKYFLTAKTAGHTFKNDSDLYSFLTFNGEFSSGIGEGVTNGVFDFAAPSAQSDTVQNVAKSVANLHYNQYGLISTFSSNGVRTIKKVLRQCTNEANQTNSQGYLLIMDDDTFGNFEEEYETPVRVQLVNDVREKEMLLALPISGALAYYEPNLDVSQFSGTGANGVTYVINRNHVEFIMAEKMQIKPYKESETQDVVYSHIPFMGQWMFSRLPAHGVIAGGNS